MRVRFLAASVSGLLFLYACSDHQTSVEPNFAVGTGMTIRLADQCEAESFNAALGPGNCVRDANGGIAFDKFIGLLTQTGDASAWRITPTMLHVDQGVSIPVTNVGGEVHTYTEVAEFGGGIVPILNQLTGNTTVAPECNALGAGDFIQPGQTVDHVFDDAEIEKHMCCIHPWMRQVVHVR